MRTEERRNKVLQSLQNSKEPLTGTQLAAEYGVSRQIIVGDISILRAMGTPIYATPRGYILPEKKQSKGTVIATITCRHDGRDMRRELETIVDEGACVRDVIVEHPVYGEIHGHLMLSSRHDIDVFIEKMEQSKAKPLLDVSSGVHLHTLEVPGTEALNRIVEKLKKLGILAEGGQV
ncbi:MAG: transcription repressor NadR [Schwartzia sp.]|nr:transcription repressor NadR [Schwartzia sp. (in: firmicutes)]